MMLIDFLLSITRIRIDWEISTPYNRAPERLLNSKICGNNSVVVCQLPKLMAAGSNPVFRSNNNKELGWLA
jgi:hypothetical protein